MDTSHYRTKLLVFFIIFAVSTFLFWSILRSFAQVKEVFDTPTTNKSNGDVKSWCPLTENPPNFNDGLDLSSKFEEPGAIELQVERLSEAVRVATVSYDDNGNVGEDERWNVFFYFHDVLNNLFPLLREKVKMDRVNELGLLYIWEGTDSKLKPVMFTAHQDVVPATTPDKWTHPPFVPYYDGKFVWGRGASDCKNNLIGLLSVMEDLLSQHWKPKRTIILGFGFDEETGGVRGAAYLAAELEKRYGKEGIVMIMDEGGMGLESYGDFVYALPAVAEKGFLDVILTLEVNGGHSSRPPEHSGIGIMAEIIVALEQNPFKPRLTKENPFRGFLECQVRYTPHEVEPWLKDALLKGDDEVNIGNRLAEARGKNVRFSIQTSQAVDIIQAGEKSNQLPESVRTVVNYRVAPHDSLASVKRQIVDVVLPIANKHGIHVRGFEYTASPDEAQTSFTEKLILSSKDDLSSSPISPTSSTNPVWTLFAGVIRQVFESTSSFSGKTVVPVGDIMMGNTDTIHYWNLTKNIYRFTPARAGTRKGVHTVDERIEMKAHVEGMRVYYDMMRAFGGGKVCDCEQDKSIDVHGWGD